MTRRPPRQSRRAHRQALPPPSIQAGPVSCRAPKNSALRTGSWRPYHLLELTAAFGSRAAIGWCVRRKEDPRRARRPRWRTEDRPAVPEGGIPRHLHYRQRTSWRQAGSCLLAVPPVTPHVMRWTSSGSRHANATGRWPKPRLTRGSFRLRNGSGTAAQWFRHWSWRCTGTIRQRGQFG